MLITNSDTFLSEMSKLFAANQSGGGSLYITMKRVDMSVRKPTPRPISRLPKPKGVKSKKAIAGAMAAAVAAREAADAEAAARPAENMCLIRVHSAARKISTLVAPKDVNKFQQAYSNLLRGNLYGLKKKEKKGGAGGGAGAGASKSAANKKSKATHG